MSRTLLAHYNRHVAYNAGWLMGAEINSHLSDCGEHRNEAMRRAWIEGFSDGRTNALHKRKSEQDHLASITTNLENELCMDRTIGT